MKSKITIILFLFLTIHSVVSAQDRSVNEKDVPVQVKDYLSTTYPESGKKEYYKISKNDTAVYEVEFVANKVRYNLKFTQQGELLETEKEIELEDLDPAVRLKITLIMEKTFSKSKIHKVQEVDPTGLRRYEVTAKIKSKKDDAFTSGVYAVLFDESGQLLKIEKEELNSIESVF